MKLRALSSKIALAIAFGSLSMGCFFIPVKPVEKIQGDWTSPLDKDLAVAAPNLDAFFKSQGWDAHLQWVGVRGSDYGIERGPLGEPLRKSVLAMYAFEMPKTGKCYLQGEGVLAYDVKLAREHLGGGQYGPPRIVGFTPIKNDGNPVGPEIICGALASTKGGFHSETSDTKAVADGAGSDKSNSDKSSNGTNSTDNAKTAAADPSLDPTSQQEETAPKSAGPGAAITVAPFTATLSRDKVKKVELKGDGSIFADGKKVAVISGSSVKDTQGATLLSILADGRIESDSAPNMRTRFVSGDLVHREDKVTLSDDGTIVLVKKQGIETVGKIDKGNKAKRTVLLVLAAVAINAKK